MQLYSGRAAAVGFLFHSTAASYIPRCPFLEESSHPSIAAILLNPLVPSCNTLQVFRAGHVFLQLLQLALDFSSLEREKKYFLQENFVFKEKYHQ